VKEWYTVKEIAEGLGMSDAGATKLIRQCMSKRPGTSLVRRVRNEKNRMRYELHHTLYSEEYEKRVGEVNWSAGSVELPPAGKYTTNDGRAVLVTEVVNTQAEDPYPPVGASYTLEDGTIVERWSPERYKVLEQELLALDSLRRTAELHQAEIERLQAAYEAHISTYEQQAQYLRERIDKYETFLGDAMKALRERNYIDASNLHKE
jgi:DNA-binding MarR family transcriptional regulator